MSKPLDLVGQRFGQLVVIKREDSDKHGKSRWLCQCDCGNTTITSGSMMKKGNTRSCGCLEQQNRNNLWKHKYRHGMSDTVEHWTWKRLFARCYNPNSEYYYLYGGKGIEVCDRWNPKKGGSFENFFEDMGKRPANCSSIERIDGNSDYSPENCRWANYTEQAYNTTQNRKITIEGVTKNLTEWAKESPVTTGAIRHRLEKLGWSEKDAVFKPKAHPGKSGSTLNYQGQEYSVREFCTQFDIPLTTFRRNKGLGLEEIISKYSRI